MNSLKTIIILFAVLIISGKLSAQETATFYPTEDYTLSSANIGNRYDYSYIRASSNNGTIERSLMRFNISSLPNGATITNATISFTAADILLHQMLVNYLKLILHGFRGF